MGENTRSRYNRYLRYAGSAILLTVFVYFALLTDAFYSAESGNQNQSIQIAQIAPALPLLTSAEPEQREEIQIVYPANGIKTAFQAIAVSGIAPNDAVVDVFVNGKLIETTSCRGSQYHFSNVLLTKHANVIQTRYSTQSGNSNSSRPILIFYRGPIVTQQANAAR